MIVAFRIFKKYLTTKMISVLTLSIGFLFFLISITIYVKDIKFNDKFKNSNRIFRVDTEIQFNSGDVQEISASPAGVGPFVKSRLSVIENQTRIWAQPSLNLKVDQSEYFGEDIVRVDLSFFNLFDFPILHGSLNKENLLRTDIAILSEQEAIKLYGKSNPIGKFFSIDESVFEVVAVIKNLDTDFDRSVYLPIAPDVYEFEWTETFILIAGKYDHDKLTVVLNAELEKLMAGQYNEDIMKISFDTVSLSEMRFQDKLFGTLKSNRGFLNFILMLSLALLAICCFSVLNLESTISIRRSKEIEVKKIFGASKLRLFFQYFAENSIVFMISVPIAFLVYFLLLPVINYSWNYDLQVSDIFDFLNLVCIAIVSSLYLALIATINYILHFSSRKDGRTQSLNNPIFVGIKRLVLPFQVFICSIIVLFTSLSSNQIKHTNNVDVNFDYRDVYVLDILAIDDDDDLTVLKNELTSKAYVLGVSLTNRKSIPGRESDMQVFNLNSSESDKEIVAQHIFIDEDYFAVLGIKSEFLGELNNGAVLVNEQMSSSRSIDLANDNTLNHSPIVGHVNNYYHDGVFGSIKPTVFEYDESKFNALLVKVKEGTDFKQVKSMVDDLIKTNDMKVGVNVFAMNDIYFTRQASDRRLLDIIQFCNYFVIVITILGIFSSSNMLLNLAQRQNAIRRVLGALKVDILKSTAKHIYAESLIGLFLATIFTHYLFFNWQEKYSIKAPFDIKSYFSIFLIMLLAIIAFVILFIIKLRKIKTTDLTSSE